MQVLDEFRAEKSDDERNQTQTSVMQSMYVLYNITFSNLMLCFFSSDHVCLHHVL